MTFIYSASNPYPQILNLQGTGLNDGDVYFGVAGQDPVDNPITVYWDADGLIPAAQPVPTSGGYLYRSGTPANVYINNQPYSIKVLDKNGAQIYYQSNVLDPVFEFISALAAPAGADFIGFSQAETYGQGTVGLALQRQVSIKDAPFNASCDGVTDDAAAIAAALATFPDYVGGVLIIPPNTAIASTITIADKKGLIIQGENGQGFGFVGTDFIPSLKWIGASGGKMFAINNVLNLTMHDLAISGEDTADYGLYFEGSTSGWGVSNYENVVVYGCNKNPVYKGRASGAPAGNDFGRNHWKRCTFRKSNTASGTPKDDACYTYENDSGVQDVFDHCEWLYTSGGVVVPSGYGMWVEAGTPRIYIRDSYTKTANGIFAKSSGATPKFQIFRHYSEDANFTNLPNAATRQVLDECVHVVSGGVSIAWGGSSGSGAPLVINGGSFAGSVSLTNTNAPIVLGGSPQFLGGYPTISDPSGLIQVGRSSGSGVAAVEAHAALNAAAFVPKLYANTGTNINPSLRSGTVCTQTLSANTIVNAPATIDANGLDVGREIWLKITGHATNVYTVTFNAVFKLAGSAYVHSGAAKTDILKFMWDGTNWWETGRSMNMA